MRSFLSRAAIFSLVAFGLSACTPASSDSSDAGTGIVNGHLVTTRTPLSARTVLIVGELAAGTYTCTGSLLPNNIVLTAAHCVAPDSNRMAISFARTLEIPPDFSSPLLHKVVARRHDPLHDSIGSDMRKRGGDLGMIRFAGKVPAGSATFDVPGNLNVSMVDPNGILYLIGYGVTSPVEDDEGILRATMLPASALVDRSGGSSNVIMLRQPNTGACEGDSGGPLAIIKNGVPQILGVASGVANGASLATEDLCKGIAVYTGVSGQADWIGKTFRALSAIR